MQTANRTQRNAGFSAPSGRGPAQPATTRIDVRDPKWRRLARTLSEIGHPAAQFALWVAETGLPFSTGCQMEAQSDGQDKHTLAQWQAFCEYWRPRLAITKGRKRFHVAT